MANDTLSQIAKIVVAKGERDSSDDESTIFDMSELSLVVENRDGKAYPAALSFTLWGVDLTKSSDGAVYMLDSDDEDTVSSFAIDDEIYLEHINRALAARLDTLRDLGI